LAKEEAMPQDDIRRYLKHGTLPQLRVFEASVRLGSLARAAEELHMAPPTACMQVKKLSETVGAPLFEQVGRRLYPTEAGLQVYESCGEVFGALSALERNLARERTLERGGLRLAVTSAARCFAPRLLGEFAAAHPGIDTALHVGNWASLAERLRRNEDHLYLFAHPPRDRELVSQAVLRNPFVVLSRRGHPLARVRGIPFARMAAEPFIMREQGSGTRAAVVELFGSHGMAPRVHMELDSNESIREAIAAGCGISILPRYTLGRDGGNADLACLDVEGFPLEAAWHFVYPVGKQVTAATRAFLDFSRQHTRRPEE